MTKIDKDQLDKISGGAESPKFDHATTTIRPWENGEIDKADEISPARINPVVRPGEADS